MRRLEKVGVPVSPINDVAELVAAEQTGIIGMIQKAPSTLRAIVDLPISYDHRPPVIRTRSPTLGEHNATPLRGGTPQEAGSSASPTPLPPPHEPPVPRG